MKRLLVCLSLWSIAGGVTAKPANYRFDPVHSQLVFFIKHLEFSHAIGRFSAWTGQFRFDPEDWSSATVDVTIPVATLDLGDDGWNRKILGAQWLNAQKFADMRFISERVQPIDADDARVIGQLTLLGITRPVTLDVHLNDIGVHSLTFKPTVGFTATARLQRSAFGLTTSSGSVGDEIEIRIEVEGQRIDPAMRKPRKR